MAGLAGRTTSLRRRRFLAWSGAAACLGPVRPVRAHDALRVLLPPFLSTVSLLQAFRPLREHLERHLGERVDLYTRPDFRSLVPELQRGEIDVALLAGHLAGLAVRDWGHRPLNATLQDIEVLLLVRATGPVRTPQDLRGASVGTLDPVSLVSSVGRRWLRERGLLEPGGARIEEFRSISSVVAALDHGDIAAAVAARSQLMALEGKVDARLRILGEVRDVPGPAFVASPRLPPARVVAIRDALAAFEPDPQRPSTVSNTRYAPIDDALLARLLRHADAAADALAATASVPR